MKIKSILKTKKYLILISVVSLSILAFAFIITKVNNATTFADNIIKLSKNDKENMIKDDYGNIRYIGKNPNNYVSFNNELWRIIGVFDGKVKLIRNESIGTFSWDVSDENINEGNGIGDWSQSDLMYELNIDYLDTSLTGKKSWKCNDSDCDFNTNLKLSSLSQQLITNHEWKTGTIYWKVHNEYEYFHNYLYLNAKEIYDLETNDVDHELEFKNKSIYNDNVTRKASWNGIVGLPSLSDILYSSKDSCTLNKIKENYSSGSASNHCFDNNWMINEITDSDLYWTLDTVEYIAYNDIDYSLENIIVYLDWFSAYPTVPASNTYNVKPTVYLNNSVKLTGGNGSMDNPFTIEIKSNKKESQSEYEELKEKIRKEYYSSLPISGDTEISDDAKVNDTNSEYDVSMFEQLTTTQAINKIKNMEKAVLYIGRPTCKYSVQMLPNLQRAQKEFGYKTIYVDLDLMTKDEEDKWANFGGVLGEYDGGCEERRRYYSIEAKTPKEECGQFGVTPMIVIFENGEIKDSFIGYEEYDKFASFLENNGFKK